MGQVIHFEDNGQDFTKWTVQDGIVVDCYPFQQHVWNGTKILSKPKVGHKLDIEHKTTGKSRLKYKIVKIEKIPDMAECVACGAEVADPGVGVRCENESEEGEICGGRLERKGINK